MMAGFGAMDREKRARLAPTPRATSGMPDRRLILALLVLAGLTSCAHEIRRFPLADPLWVDEGDFRAFQPMPEEYFSPFAWDGADQMLFRPLSRFFAVDPAGRAVNVNAMDEVPDSSWYTNRLSRGPLERDVLTRGACGDEPPLDPAGPWTITSAKPNGANPGFIIEDAEGRKFLLKFDSPTQPERATAADVMGSLIYWGAGFSTPCNRAVFFDREILAIEEGATANVGGEDVPMTWEMLAPAFEKATRLSDGRFRGASSQFLPGIPLGPWRYEGTRDDDPNDVIPHQDRRELRGAYVLAAWINHFDSREQNTLAMWIPQGDGDDAPGYVRHNYIDWGDSFGSQWSWDGISRRLGHSSYFDLRHLLEDFVTFGTIDRPWFDAEKGPTGETLGYFGVERFDPAAYRPGYPNPAFLAADDHDKAWMARIVAGYSEDDVRAIVDQAQIQDPLVDQELKRILLGRRERILRTFFRELSALSRPVVVASDEGSLLCAEDLAVATELIEWEERPYWARAWRHVGGDDLESIETGGLVRRRPHHVCVGLPSHEGATESEPAYLIVDLNAMWSADDEDSRPLRVHLYQLGPGEYRLVGIERPESLDPPSARE